MLAFQCALRGKLIRHTFDVDSIRSERGLETSHQHLKTWSDFSDRNYTLSFYVKNGDAPGTHLELPVEWFEPKPVQRQDHPEFVRIYFRLPPKVSKLKRASRGSAPSVPSPGVMKNLQQRFPFSKPQHNSSEASSPPSSSKRKFSWNSRTSENSLSQSPPAGRLNQRCREISVHFFCKKTLLTQYSNFMFRIHRLPVDNRHNYRFDRVCVSSSRPDRAP